MFLQLKKGCYDLIAKMALRSPLHRKLVRKQVEGTRAHSLTKKEDRSFLSALSAAISRSIRDLFVGGARLAAA